VARRVVSVQELVGRCVERDLAAEPPGIRTAGGVLLLASAATPGARIAMVADK
jgi:hypothetical protein